MRLGGGRRCLPQVLRWLVFARCRSSGLRCLPADSGCRFRSTSGKMAICVHCNSCASHAIMLRCHVSRPLGQHDWRSSVRVHLAGAQIRAPVRVRRRAERASLAFLLRPRSRSVASCRTVSLARLRKGPKACARFRFCPHRPPPVSVATPARHPQRRVASRRALRALALARRAREQRGRA